MLEIYSEQVRDLLNPKSFSVKGGLKLRQDPKRGFYGSSVFTFSFFLSKAGTNPIICSTSPSIDCVAAFDSNVLSTSHMYFCMHNDDVTVEGVKTVGVNSYNEISQKVDEGKKNRTIGSTNMNATSRYRLTSCMHEHNYSTTVW